MQFTYSAFKGWIKMQYSLLTAGIYSNYLGRCALQVSKIYSHRVIAAVTQLCALEIIPAAVTIEDIHCTP